MAKLPVALIAAAIAGYAAALNCEVGTTPAYNASKAAVSTSASHAVGRIHLFDAWNGTSLITTILYPATPADGATPDMLDAAEMQLLPAAFASLVTRTMLKTGSFRDAPAKPPPTGTAYPVVVFMHGDASSHVFSMHLMEQVVAMGFVVIATDDPCVNVRASIEALTGSKQPNGTFCPNHLETADHVRARATRGDLTKGPNATSSLAAKDVYADIVPMLLPHHYALTGHSLGGIAATYAGGRCGAVRFTGALQINPYRLPNSELTSVFPTAFESYAQITGGNDKYTTAETSRQSVSSTTVADDGFRLALEYAGAPHEAVSSGLCYVIWANRDVFDVLVNVIEGLAGPDGDTQFLTSYLAHCDKGETAVMAMDHKFSTAHAAALALAFTGSQCASDFVGAEVAGSAAPSLFDKGPALMTAGAAGAGCFVKRAAATAAPTTTTNATVPTPETTTAAAPTTTTPPRVTAGATVSTAAAGVTTDKPGSDSGGSRTSPWNPLQAVLALSLAVSGGFWA